MKVSTMRRVDRWLGTPVCAFLTAWRRVAALWAGSRSGPLRRILFVKLAEQGSTVLAYPALRRAVDLVGPENVYFLAFEPNRFILDAMQVIPEENVVTIDTRSLPTALLSSLTALFRLRRLRLDAAVDLEFFARSSAIFSYLSGARRRVGLHAYSGDGPWRGNLMTHPLGYNPHLHTSRTFRLEVDVLEQPSDRLPALDLVPIALADLPRGSFTPGPEEVAEVAALVREAAGVERLPPLILLNANCSDLLPLRRWDESNYIELARRVLAVGHEQCVAFTGAADEAEAVERLVRQVGSPRCISLAGRTTLRQLLVLYGLADVLVTNDSGPAHFASLTPIHVVTLFGPETPELFGGLSPNGHELWAATACSPCVNAYNNRQSVCRNNVCMQRIGVDQVHEAVSRALAVRRGESREADQADRGPAPRIVIPRAAGAAIEQVAPGPGEARADL